MKLKVKKPKQVFVRVIDINQKRFLKKLAAFNDMTLHCIFLKGGYYTWNDNFTDLLPATKYAALLSYTV